jgi:hypothetical protein
VARSLPGPDELADLFEAFNVAVTYDNQPTRSSSPAPSQPNSYRPQKDCDRLVGGRRILT